MKKKILVTIIQYSLNIIAIDLGRQVTKFMKLKLVVFILLLIVNRTCFAQCIPVVGLQFERISNTEIMASKNGKNYAALVVSTKVDFQWGSLPEKIGAFRFFSEELCNFGAESRFHIDGNLYYLRKVELFKK